MDKKELRQIMLKKRNQLSDKEVSWASTAIFEQLREFFIIKQSRAILSYMPYGREADILPLNQWILQQGKILCLPRVINGFEMEAVRVESLEKGLIKSSFGILEPSRVLRPRDIGDIEVILVPGLAFDRQGNRLGHGRGYYDRFLSGINKNVFNIGIAYSFQVLEHIPADAHDKRLDGIVTEKEILILKTA